MSEKMSPLGFDELIGLAVDEYKRSKTVFGVHRPYIKKKNGSLTLFGEGLESPLGAAAGPNTQMAQNIISAYFAGARFFELKTVQIMDGEALAACIARPCILADDEGYNCEWSTELTVAQAADEYVKAWLALKTLSKAFGLGDENGFMFNMSVGYDLDGIKSEKVDAFIEVMKDASILPYWNVYRKILKKYFPEYTDYIDTISPHICSGVTLSTLHGCPPQEIERIASYLITEKKLNTFVKCNPTILGYDYARKTLDSMGYDYIAFDDHHFREDLQYGDAIPMFKRLKALAESNSLDFGLKLSNTFPVDVTAGELPSEEMYMSGKALYPLTIEMAARISADVEGIRISYSGGADYFNIDRIFDAGIWPITVATTILKPGGYQRLTQMAEKLEGAEFGEFKGVDAKKARALSDSAKTDIHHIKPVKPLPSRKTAEKVPLVDCFAAPCKGGCPIGQDIPEYISLVGKGEYLKALKVITAKNPLPFITGTICAHRCMTKCTRNFYEEPVMIRAMKLTAAQNGYDGLMSEIRPADRLPGVKAAVVGGGAAGMSAAYFLGINGAECTLFEKENRLGGIVRRVIPSFRIDDTAIDRDEQLIRSAGAEIRTGEAAPSMDELFRQGYTHILYCVGASKKGGLDIGGNVINAIDFLASLKTGHPFEPGSDVVVVGGGNTAMDAARAAKRLGGVKNVSILYRRTKKYMPADEEELMLASYDGVKFIELASPVSHKDGVLTARKTILGPPDESGRRSPVDTDELMEIKADTVIAAVGEAVDSDFFAGLGIETKKGRPAFKTNIKNVYTAGDALRGPCTVVECIADAKAFAEEVLGKPITADIPAGALDGEDVSIAKKGILKMPVSDESERCLSCGVICGNCADVCPNRANIVVKPKGMGSQIVHIDALCNECGNCSAFCPYDSSPYRDKLTLFNDMTEFEGSANSGFIYLGDDKFRVRLNGETADYDLSGSNALDKDIENIILTVKNEYAPLLTK